MRIDLSRHKGLYPLVSVSSIDHSTEIILHLLFNKDAWLYNVYRKSMAETPKQTPLGVFLFRGVLSVSGRFECWTVKNFGDHILQCFLFHVHDCDKVWSVCVLIPIVTTIGLCCCWFFFYGVFLRRWMIFAIMSAMWGVFCNLDIHVDNFQANVYMKIKNKKRN